MHCPSTIHSKIKTGLLLLFFVSLTVVWGVSFAKAQIDDVSDTIPQQDQTTLTAIPPRLGDDGSIVAKPGEVLQKTIQVRNTSGKPINILSLASDFILDKDGATPIPLTDEQVSGRWSLASWITVAPNLQTVAPNEIKSISVVINVPDDALPGGHYAMITHQPTTATPETITDETVETNVSASGISQKVGTLLYVKVDGPINESAFVRSFAFPNLTEYGPVPFSFSVENQSDIHIQPALMMEIRDMFGRKVDQFTVESKNIFPLTERQFDGNWDKVWGYGRYTATLTMNYGTQGAVAIAKASFWLFPVTLVVAVVIGFLVLVAMMIAIRRHLIHRKTDQSAKIKELEDKLAKLESEK